MTPTQQKKEFKKALLIFLLVIFILFALVAIIATGLVYIFPNMQV